MSISIGDTAIGSAFVGETGLSSIWLGDRLIWNSTPTAWVASTTIPSGNRIHYGINGLSVGVLKQCATAISECSDITYQTITCYVDTGHGYYEFNAQDSTNRITWMVNNRNYQFVLVGFNHYQKSDGSGNAGMTFMCYDPDIGSYSIRAYYNWIQNPLKDVCDSDLPDLFPTEVYAAMVPVDIVYRTQYNRYTTATTNSTIFVPSIYEVTGYASEPQIIQEGNQWCYFTRDEPKQNYLIGGWLYRTCGLNNYGLLAWGRAYITSSTVYQMLTSGSGSGCVCPCFCF